MVRRTARQSAHSAAVHGGQLRFRLPAACSAQDERHEDWEVVSVSTEDSFEVVGGGYCRASATLSEQHRCVLHRQRNKRAAAWSLERDLCDRLSQRHVQVRIISADDCDLRVKVSCWFADARKPEAQTRLDAAFQEALTAMRARNEEAIRRDDLQAIALRHTPADYELSRSSWVRRIGVMVRPRRIGFFCAFPWEYGAVDWAQAVQGERLLAHEETTSARIGRRASPAHCSARTGHRRSRRLEQSTERRSRARARAEATRIRGLRRRREADEKQQERDLFVDVPAIGRRRPPETILSYGVAHGVELWLVRWSFCGGGAAARQRWMEWSDLLSEDIQNAAQQKKEDIVYGNPWWPYDGPAEADQPWEVALGWPAIVY